MRTPPRWGCRASARSSARTSFASWGGGAQPRGGAEATVVFADPPYDLDALERLPDLALALVAPGGVFVLEHDTRHAFDEHPALDTSRRYGGTVVSVFRQEG